MNVICGRSWCKHVHYQLCSWITRAWIMICLLWWKGKILKIGSGLMNECEITMYKPILVQTCMCHMFFSVTTMNCLKFMYTVCFSLWNQSWWSLLIGLWSKRRHQNGDKSKRRQVQNKRKSVLSYADYMKSISALLGVQLLVSSDGLPRWLPSHHRLSNSDPRSDQCYLALTRSHCTNEWQVLVSGA